MKKNKAVSVGLSLFTIFFLLTSAALSQEYENQGRALFDAFSPIKHSDINSDDFSDLEFLKDKIGNSRFVFLGEESHGAGTTMLMKGRLIKFLHEEMGFNIMAWESGAVSVDYSDKLFLDRGTPAINAGQRGIFGVWTAAKEMQPLLTYLKKARSQDIPLINVGFDSQMSGHNDRPEFPKELEGFFNSGKKKLLTQSHLQTIKDSFKDYSSYSYALKNDGLCQEIMNIFKSAISTLKSNSSYLTELHSEFDVEYMRYKLESMLMEFNRYNLYEKGDDFSWDSVFERDRCMAVNFIKIAEKLYPEERIIVWAHSVHNMRNPTLMTGSNFGYKFTMGHALWEEYHDDIYNIAFVSYDGSVSDNGYRTEYICYPPPQDSISWHLERTGNEYGLLDIRGLSGGHWLKNEKVYARFEAPNFYRANWNDICDAFLFIKTAKPKTFCIIASDKEKSQAGREKP